MALLYYEFTLDRRERNSYYGVWWSVMIEAASVEGQPLYIDRVWARSRWGAMHKARGVAKADLTRRRKTQTAAVKAVWRP